MKFKKYKHLEDFYYENNQIILTPSGLEKSKQSLKKITGSRISAVLGKNDFLSPFQVWCDILGFYETEIEPFFVNAGKAIEPKLLKFISEEFKKNYISYDPKNISFDLFKNVEIFGGIPDGEEWNGKTLDSLLEIKTATIDKYKWKKENNEYKLVKVDDLPIIEKYGGNLSKWFSHKKFIIPKEYQYQLGLYLYLRKIEKGYFCVTFLNMSDYLNPESFSPYKIDYVYKDLPENKHIPEDLNKLFIQDRIIVFEEMKIDLHKFEKIIHYLRHWYKYHIHKGISPQLSTTDLDWLRYSFTDL